MNIKRFICCLPLLGLFLPPQGLAAVKIGQSCALTGGVSFLGVEMQKGAKAYFDKHAADSIVLTTKDDQYLPEHCEENTKAFIADGAQALFGYVGTTTSAAAIPLANAGKTVYFGAFTGAEFVSDAKTNPYAFALRPSYAEEVENMMRHLKEDLGIKKVALFVQRDAFGLAGVEGAIKAEKKLGGITVVPAVPPVPAEGSPTDPTEAWNTFWSKVPSYKPNTVAVGGAVRQVRGHMPEAIILIGVARPAALAVNEWAKMDFHVPMITLAVGAKALAERVEHVEHLYFSEIMPDPWDASLPVVKQYQEDMGDAKYDFTSLEGYLAAKVLHQAIASIQGEVTGEAMKTALEAMSDYDAGGIKVSFGPDDHRGLDTVYLAKAEKEGKEIKFVYVDKLTPPEEEKAAAPAENPEAASEQKKE
jgi:ABC-type branched-subunit amino acid transport system substrate-binding protein